MPTENWHFPNQIHPVCKCIFIHIYLTDTCSLHMDAEIDQDVECTHINDIAFTLFQFYDVDLSQNAVFFCVFTRGK